VTTSGVSSTVAFFVVDVLPLLGRAVDEFCVDDPALFELLELLELLFVLLELGGFSPYLS